MPTVSLMALSYRLEDAVLAEVIKGCLSIGTLLFATYGEFADEMEDQIDLVLESESRLEIITTSHQDDAIEDTANFLVSAAYRESDHFRCLVILDKRVANSGLLLKAVEKLCMDLSEYK
ncbi:hypothetical protein [Janthinobacterium agaricidamnosum]|uniref:hypothetical protein n=1 Tax=Janthinobacterium agaricidamnosum TaxID=55508 RepID=UPI001184E348|nr:hypothetical protein [Janthinobacterium agaricidamnosum]